MTKPLAAASTLMGAAIAGLSLGSAAFAVAIFSAIWFGVRRHSRYGRNDQRDLIPLVDNHPDSPPSGEMRFLQIFYNFCLNSLNYLSGFDNVLIDPVLPN